jgi:hypothetical protein
MFGYGGEEVQKVPNIRQKTSLQYPIIMGVLIGGKR